MSDQNVVKDFSIKVDRSTGKLLKLLSDKEDRTIKAIVDRAVKLYAARDPKMLP